ncbi:DUF86 domain-containing protein [Candidatus Saganbacteria bacterium]|nr:DUF86 domain-containing protein [Candidatus Saganbacteria bacterium]
MKEEIVEKLKDLFASKKEISMAFLFGSQATGKTTSESDIDVAVWFSKNVELNEIDRLWLEIESLLHNNVDLIILNQANPNTAWAAMRGITLKITDYRLYYIDICKILLAGEDIEMPNSYREVILKLAEMKILTLGKVEKIADYANLRNILAHQYLDIKWDKIRSFIANALDDYNEFIAIISKKIGI